MSLCVIPARGGSKRIPRKNVKPFFGKPMIVWSIEAALASGVVDHVLVTTDDPEIADVARAAGADDKRLGAREVESRRPGHRVPLSWFRRCLILIRSPRCPGGHL